MKEIVDDLSSNPHAAAFTRPPTDFVVPMYEREEQYGYANAKSLLEELIAKDEEMKWLGCFRYTAEPDGDRAEIHIANNRAPDSPFSDRCRKFAWMQQLARRRGGTPRGSGASARARG